ncbi:MAG: PBP1A family penicillin-binding protein [Candidatus Paceibacterota bacterium]
MNKNKKFSHKPFKILKNILFFLFSLAIISTGVIFIWVSTLKLPDFKLFTERKIENSTKIYDRTGEILLFDVHENIKRTVIPYEEIGVNIKNATVAIEDSEFYNHKGIRLKAIIRAVWSNISGGKVQGGSTITQQLIKNTLLTSEKSISRKIKEWILSVKLEKVLSKEDILTLYLNEAPYGGNIYGIEEASKAFFNKKPLDLTMAESAYLAAIPNGPTYYSPYRKNKDKLDERKNLVLKRMFDLGFIDEETYNNSKNEVVVFMPERLMNISAPHFVFFIKDYLENNYGVDALEGGGFSVITTLDYDLQKKVEEIVKERSKENEKLWGGSNAAVVVIDPKTGQILAMVGSRDYFDSKIDGNFNVTTAKRQPGSSFKPIVYAKAFEKGYTADTTLFDVKTEFNSSCDPTGKPLPGHSNATCYMPDDYDNNFRGPMTLKNALAQSINIIAVKLLYLVGINDAIKTAKDLGITTLTDPARYGLSLVIGGGETTLLEMTSAYSVFATNGIRHPYNEILSIKDPSGKILEEYKEKTYQVLNQNTTDILSNILSDDIARTPTFGASSILNIPGHEVAVKTGTTNDNKDAWTIGYTPSVTVGVWVGNNDNTPMKNGGAALAGPIWNDVLSYMLKDKPNEFFQEPEPINQSLPPILRGFWQGGETFMTNSLLYSITTGLPIENNKKEVSITNVHTILYWLDKNDPLNIVPTKNIDDPQYPNWEYGVQKWWEKNSSQYKNISSMDKPAEENKATQTLEFIINGVSKDSYKNTDTVSFTINSLAQTQIKKIDVFVNNIYLKSLKTFPFSLSFVPKEILNIKNENIVRVVGYDVFDNVGETTTLLFVNN